MKSLHQLIIASFTAMALALAGCAIQPPEQPPAGVAPAARWTSDAALQSRLLALDPAHISDRDVRETLAKGPTPRIMLLHGGVYPVHLIMESFGTFLTGMGYPEAQIRDPGNGDWSYSPYLQTSQLAGLVAWQYEHDGLHPMLVGHSQGGLSAVRILKDLAGWDGDVRVYNPLTATLEDRTTIVDPLTGRKRPVVGVSVAYASAVGAGGLALVLPGWWESLDTLRKIPDTVDEFTGYFIEVDLIALSIPGNPLDRKYENGGKAHVRNVTLPATYNHIVVPLTASLADDPVVRDWINAYVPDQPADTSMLPASAAGHVLWAADVWYSIKKHWCLEAQQWVRAQRARVATESTPH
jgi:hypothetical protein